MSEHQNDRVRLGILSKYKNAFEFVHFLDEYKLYSFLTNPTRSTRIRFRPMKKQANKKNFSQSLHKWRDSVGV